MAQRLNPGEQVVIRTRSHPRALVKPAVWFVVLAWLCGLFQGILSRPGVPDFITDNKSVLMTMIYLLLAIALVLVTVRPLWQWVNRYLVVTSQRVLEREGALRRRRRWLSLSAMHDVRVRQSRRERHSGRGELQLFQASGQLWALPDVPEVGTVAQVVNEQRAEQMQTYGYYSPSQTPMR